MKKLFSNYNIILRDEQVTLFEKYYELLIEWNQRMNLTSIEKYEDVCKKHFLDSCLLCRCYSADTFYKKRVIDVGTGAGFPGIPLAILFPETSFTLIDSLNKRIDFLKVVTEELRLDHVTLFHGRAEDFARYKASDQIQANASPDEPLFRESFDYCVSRAVAPLSILLEYCSPFIKTDGKLLLYKGKKVKEELFKSEHALSVLNCKVSDTIELVKEEEYERYLLVVEKNGPTPKEYPRKAGKAKKKPL